MCGRFVNHETVEAASLRFRATSTVQEGEWEPTYNAAPSQLMPVVIEDSRGRRIGLMRWGWPKRGGWKGEHIHAVGETAHRLPTFADAWAHRRCLIPATAFYEWQEQGSGRRSVPFAFRLPDQELFGIAGLWQTIELKGKRVGAFILLTTGADAATAPINHRMAGMLPAGSEDLWLDPAAPLDALQTLFSGFDSSAVVHYRVSDRVNKSSARGAELLMPADAAEPGLPGSLT